MGVVRARIQTVEDLYQLVWTAVASKRPIEARYQGHPRYFVRTDWGGIGKGKCECCAISTAGKARADFSRRGSPANWRCLALEKLSCVRLLEDVWRTAPNHSRPASCLINADIDAEDQAEREPQKGQKGS
jgi:hypothetical protein